MTVIVWRAAAAWLNILILARTIRCWWPWVLLVLIALLLLIETPTNGGAHQNRLTIRRAGSRGKSPQILVGSGHGLVETDL